MTLPSANCQRAPRSPGLDLAEPIATGGWSRPLLSSSMRHWIAAFVTEVTAHEALPTRMRSAVVSAPKPVPKMVRSVPPANEPSLGTISLIRGNSSASKGDPVERSIAPVLMKPRYAFPRCLASFRYSDRLKKPAVRPGSSAPSLQPKELSLEYAVATAVF